MSMSVPGNSCSPRPQSNTGCILTSSQVCYSGPSLAVSGINTGDTLTVVIQKLVSSPTVAILDTASVNLSGTGSTLSPITADVKISATSGNIISILSDGLYAATSIETPFGYRYNETSWTSLSDFTVNGATVAVVSNALSFSGGTGAFTQTLDITDPTLLEKFTISARFTVATTGAGLGIGPRSINSTPRHAIATLNTTTGLISIYVLSGPLLVATSTAAITFNSTDIVELTLEQNGFTLLASARNVTTGGDTITVNYTYKTAPFTFVNSMPNTGRMAIWSLGGSFTINSLNWFTPTPINAKLLVIGDSKTKGYYTTGFGSRYVDLLNSHYRTTIVSAGGADNLVVTLARIQEIIDLAPENAMLAIGRNDISTNPNINADYDSLVSQLQAANIKVWHLLGFWETVENQIPFITHITSTYPAADIIDCYTPTTTLNSLYSDGIHLTDLGNRIIYETIVKANKIPNTSFSEQNVIRNQNFYVENGTFSITGPGTFDGAAAQVSILNQGLFNATSNPLIDSSSTWNTTGTPVAFRMAITDTASNAASKLANWSVGGVNLFSVDKTGKLAITGTLNGVQQTIKIPAGQTLANPILQIQNSAGTPIVNISAITTTNFFIGIGAGATTTSGTGNTIIGTSGFFGNPFANNTTGGTNTGLGTSVLLANISGGGNTAIGNNAMISNTTANQNTMVGQAAGAFLITGGNNVGVGVNACKGGVGTVVPGSGTGTNNVAVGTSALLNNTTGSFNVAIGGSALGGTNGNPVSQSIGIGYFVCRQGTIGLNNVVIGYFSCTADTLGDGNIYLGASISVSNTPTNTTLIGTAMTTNISNIVGIGRADQNTLIGVTTVTADNGARLQVNGDITTTDPGSGVGKWKLGTVVTAASTLDTTRYVEISIGGTVVKLAVIQ